MKLEARDCMETVNIPEQQDAAIYQAFHLMWDYYPAVVMLIRADRTIVDVNDFGKRLGVTRGSPTKPSPTPSKTASTNIMIPSQVKA